MLLNIKDLHVSYGKIKAIKGISLEVPAGEIVTLVGANGAGKTTVFNCITQFYKPNHGTIEFRLKDGGSTNLVDHKVHEIIRLGLVRTFQNVELIRELSVLDNVMIGAHIDFKASMLEQALKLPRARKEEKALREEAEEILRRLDIYDRKDMLVWGQPYGILKKVELARTLMCRPSLIILDEPAAGLNDVETLQLAQLIRRIRDKFDCSILLVEHDMRLVMDVCDRICAISFGKFLAEGTAKEIQANPLVQEAYLGSKEEENA